MKFSNSAVVLALLTANGGAFAFSPMHRPKASTTSTSLYSTAESGTTESGTTTTSQAVKSMSKKKEDRLNFMKSKRFHRRGFKEVRSQVEQDILTQYQGEIVNDLKTSNYMIDREDVGVKVYLAKDFGFCWGVERSIALAYEAVQHYPDRTLHITNELIHNPEVNDKLTSMNVNLIKKVGEDQKDFSTINEGDVVILPAFGASYEEMELLDRKVSYTYLVDCVS